MHNQSNNCPVCGRCFCGVTKVFAINGQAVCVICKPNYEKSLSNSTQTVITPIKR
jgi:hypothetical protein